MYIFHGVVYVLQIENLPGATEARFCMSDKVVLYLSSHCIASAHPEGFSRTKHAPGTMSCRSMFPGVSLGGHLVR